MKLTEVQLACFSMLQVHQVAGTLMSQQLHWQEKKNNKVSRVHIMGTIAVTANQEWAKQLTIDTRSSKIKTNG